MCVDALVQAGTRRFSGCQFLSQDKDQNVSYN